ncbi:MAG: S9 family peptidase [Gammaproteobacteria bacterium]|nr:S9 family peptidase [Gammaproteobacteria bacterium]
MTLRQTVVVLLGLCLAAAASAEITRIERGNLILENIPEIPPAVTTRLEQYQNTRAGSLAAWLPDGGLLITTRFGETNQIHEVRTPLGARRQLTFFTEPVFGATVPADPARNGFAFVRDRGGDEFYQLYWFDRASGESRLLTDGGRTQHSEALWSNAGDRYAYASTRRDGRNYDIYVAGLDDAYPEHRRVMEGEGLWLVLDWAPDDGRLLLLNYVSINEGYVFVLDIESGELTRVHDTGETVGYGAGAFDRDGSGVYLVHDHGSEFRELHHVALATGRSRGLSADIPWDVSAVVLSPDRQRMAFVVNEGGMSTLRLKDLRRNRPLPVPDLPIGVIGNLAFSPDGARLALTLNTPASPSDVHVHDLGRRTLTRWTQSEVGGLDTAKFPAPELVSFASFDGLEVPAWVYRPRGEGPHPVIVQIHGGPEAQSRPLFSPLFAYWVNELGAAVISPNVRGSSGYGKTYLTLDNGVLREDSVRDIGALLDWIETQPDLDAQRVVVYGGSYGGYMVLASLTHFDERLLGGVSIVGISSFVTFLENTQDYRRDLRRAEYGDERDPEMRAFLERISPLNNAERIRSPLFVAQGYNDPRVPYTESEQIVQAVRDNDGEVWYLLAMDEGHGFARKVNRDYFQAATVMFLRQLFDGTIE